MKFTYAVTVCNESKELYSLLAFLKKVKDPEKCVIGQHTSDEHVVFGGTQILKCKYNDAKGADNSDLEGTNDYGVMWRERLVYQ